MTIFSQVIITTLTCIILLRQGLSVEELKVRAQEEAVAKRKAEAAARASVSPAPTSKGHQTSSQSNPSAKSSPTSPGNVRKDSSPVKVSCAPTKFRQACSPTFFTQPLSSILNLPKLFSTPHTASQIGALWTAYHAAKSGGTGKGFICASVPLELYEKMATVSRKYPAFVVPVPRVKSDLAEGETDRAYEFYFLQWDFHAVPPIPSAVEVPFSPPQHDTPLNPLPTSTILFTPLQEYKMRQSFATPYLVLTFYTDLASSHGTVLMRGEITPASAGAVAGTDTAGSEGRHMLAQEDAQYLAMELQKFYLWSSGKEGDKEREGERLLKVFHEKPEAFKWEELLKHAELSA